MQAPTPLLSSPSVPRALLQDEPFDWEGDRPLNLPMEQMVIYEMHVRGFTQDPRSGVKGRGTYEGMVERLDYLQKLGVNALELLPVQVGGSGGEEGGEGRGDACMCACVGVGVGARACIPVAIRRKCGLERGGKGAKEGWPGPESSPPLTPLAFSPCSLVGVQRA